VEHYRRAVALAPDSFDPHFALARALLALGRAADAEQHFRRALELRVGFAPAQLGLAESLLAQKKPDEAARLLAAYLEQAPDDHESRVELAAVYAGLGQDGPALAELDRAAAAGFGSLRAHELRAEILVRQRKLPEAAEALENAAALASEDAALHARLGRIRLELRDFAAAERALKEALRRKPELTDALRDLGATYYLTERYDAALEVYDLVAQRETPTVYSWFVRATCYDKLGRKEEALAAYKQFVALDQGRSDKQDFQARQRIRILTRELERKKGR
jgi:tetratricopeptide (TPR) repeat protein